MTPQEADRAIKAGKAIVVRSKDFNETFTFTPLSRNRWTIYGSYESEGKVYSNGAFDRADLQILT